jgi:hypothetical protein
MCLGTLCIGKITLRRITCDIASTLKRLGRVALESHVLALRSIPPVKKLCSGRKPPITRCLRVIGQRVIYVENHGSVLPPLRRCGQRAQSAKMQSPPSLLRQWRATPRSHSVCKISSSQPRDARAATGRSSRKTRKSAPRMLQSRFTVASEISSDAQIKTRRRFAAATRLGRTGHCVVHQNVAHYLRR